MDDRAHRSVAELAGKDTEMLLPCSPNEITHVDREHSLRQLYRVAGMTGLIMLMTGDVGWVWRM